MYYKLSPKTFYLNWFQGTLLKTMKEARPTIFLGVPRVWEKLMEGMLEKGRSVKGLKKKLGKTGPWPCRRAEAHS
jgi:long-subunit acyl-CoA synthetase (AMP-forming)